MTQRKYTLPRHTNLASQSKRTGAFFVDLALLLALTLVFVFAMFRPIFKTKIDAYNNITNKEKENSGLFVKDENGEMQRIDGESHYTVFLDSLEYFYLHYMTGQNLKEGLEASKETYTFDVAWFNLNVLEINKEGSNNYFVYAQKEGVDDPNQIGVKNETTSDDIARIFLSKTKYVNAILDDFNNISNVYEAGMEFMVYSTLIYSLSGLIAGIITYIVLPWILKRGQSVGKKVFKLGLANSDGYEFTNNRLIMRLIPFMVVDLSLIFLVPLNMYVVFTIVLIIFLVSFTLSMSSPKKMALHDFVAQSLVVDLKTSVIFNNEDEEEVFIAKEDNIAIDNEESIVRGEEPELRYEK